MALDDRGRPIDRRPAVERAVRQALPEGWQARSVHEFEAGVKEHVREEMGFDWLIQSTRYDLGDYRIRLTEDLNTLIFIHSTHFHSFPADIEEATLIRLNAFTTAGLSNLLRELMSTRKPNLVHPT